MSSPASHPLLTLPPPLNPPWTRAQTVPTHTTAKDQWTTATHYNCSTLLPTRPNMSASAGRGLAKKEVNPVEPLPPRDTATTTIPMRYTSLSAIVSSRTTLKNSPHPRRDPTRAHRGVRPVDTLCIQEAQTGLPPPMSKVTSLRDWRTPRGANQARICPTENGIKPAAKSRRTITQRAGCRAYRGTNSRWKEHGRTSSISSIHLTRSRAKRAAFRKKRGSIRNKGHSYPRCTLRYHGL